MHLNTQSLRIFLAVLEHGSFSKAARSLYMSQPSVSVHVRDLETSLGAHLLHRSPAGVTPTPAGEVLKVRAQEIFSIVSSIDIDIAQAKGLADSRLVIAVTSTLSNSLLPGMLTSFSDSHDDLRVELRVGNAEEVVQWVLDREISVGVCASKIDHPQLKSHSVLDEALVLLAASHHPLAKKQAAGQPVTREDLRDARFFVREIGSSTRATQDVALTLWGCEDAQQWVIWSAPTAMELVHEGIGISLLSEHLAGRALAQGMLVALDVEPVPPRRPVTVVHLAGAKLRPIERDLITALTNLERWDNHDFTTSAALLT